MKIKYKKREKIIEDCYELMNDLFEYHGKEVQMVLVNKNDKEEVGLTSEWLLNLDNYFF